MIDSQSRSVVVRIMYGLQFEKELMGLVDRVRDSILQGRGINVTAEETLAALSAVRGTDVDLATLLPQSHSDAELREFFGALEASLRAATSKPSQGK
jgi:hypothetical protein